MNVFLRLCGCARIKKGISKFYVQFESFKVKRNVNRSDRKFPCKIQKGIFFGFNSQPWLDGFESTKRFFNNLREKLVAAQRYFLIEIKTTYLQFLSSKCVRIAQVVCEEEEVTALRFLFSVHMSSIASLCQVFSFFI